MTPAINQISSYRIFNYLFAGASFVLLADKLNLDHFYFSFGNWIVDIFYFFFIGLLMSNLRTVVVHPILKKIGFLPFSNYPAFAKAADKDPKIEIISEEGSMNGTFCSVFAVLILWKFLLLIMYHSFDLQSWGLLILLSALFIIFLFSYRAKTIYINTRIQESTIQPVLEP